MLKKVEKFIENVSLVLLILVSILIIIAIILDSYNLVLQLGKFLETKEIGPLFSSFLGEALTLVIGLEFMRMLTHHSPDLVIEILVYAIARSIIVKHPDFLSITLGVISLALLFMIRRFLLIEGVDNSPENVGRKSRLRQKGRLKSTWKNPLNLLIARHFDNTSNKVENEEDHHEEN